LFLEAMLVKSTGFQSKLENRNSHLIQEENLPSALPVQDGRFVASGGMDGIINVFDVATGKLVNTLEGLAMPIRSLAFSHSFQLLLIASDDGQIKIYDVQRAQLAGAVLGHGSRVSVSVLLTSPGI